MTAPTMNDAYDKAVRLIGDQAVQLAFAADDINRLSAEVAALKAAAKAVAEPDTSTPGPKDGT